MNEASLALIGKIGWTLVHFTWQGLVLGAATALALALLRGARSEHRYAVACGALFLCVAWPAHDLYQRMHSPVAAALGQSFGDAYIGAASPAALVSALQGQLVWIVGLWALCAAILALRMAVGLAWVSRAAARHKNHALWQARVTGMAADWRITRKVRLCLVDDLASPITAGWLKPVVMLPTALATGMPPELLEALLAHEMAHIRRFDYLVNLGQNVVETLLFYHPAVWWISGRIRIEREQIADELAASHLAAPRTLALALSELEKFQFSSHHLAMAANGGDLATRIKRLLRPNMKTQNWKASLPIFGLAFACAAVVVNAQPGAPQPVTHKALVQFSSCKKPNYPAESLRAGHIGAVVLNFLVDARGKVREARIDSSSGHAPLDASARDAISLCSFIPGKRNGEAVESWVKVKYVWTLA